jgi:hypothetical protein
MKIVGTIILSAGIFLMGGCSEPVTPNQYSDQLVVNAFIFAEQPIDSVFIQRTGNILEFYSDDAVAITNASVQITLMSASNPAAAETTYMLTHDSAKRGRYFSPVIIRPNRIYALRVTAPNYPVVTGTTLVPDTFSVITTLPPVVIWNIEYQPITVAWTQSRNYVDYIPSATSIDTTAPLINDFRSENRKADDPKPERTGYFFNIPQRHSVSIPWLGFSYLGLHKLSVSAVDKNYYDYLRQAIASGGTSLREIRYNMEGGIGVFGSAAVAHHPIYVTLVQ